MNYVQAQRVIQKELYARDLQSIANRILGGVVVIDYLYKDWTGIECLKILYSGTSRAEVINIENLTNIEIFDKFVEYVNKWRV